MVSFSFKNTKRFINNYFKYIFNKSKSEVSNIQSLWKLLVVSKISNHLKEYQRRFIVVGLEIVNWSKVNIIKGLEYSFYFTFIIYRQGN